MSIFPSFVPSAHSNDASTDGSTAQTPAASIGGERSAGGQRCDELGTLETHKRKRAVEQACSSDDGQDDDEPRATRRKQGEEYIPEAVSQSQMGHAVNDPVGSPQVSTPSALANPASSAAPAVLPAPYPLAFPPSFTFPPPGHFWPPQHPFSVPPWGPVPMTFGPPPPWTGTPGNYPGSANITMPPPPSNIMGSPFQAPPPPSNNPIPSSTTSVSHPTPLASTSQVSDRHAEILATKWYSPRKLSQLVESEGLVYKKGKFSATEEKQVDDAIEEHKRVKQLSDSQLQDIIFPKKEQEKDTDFWTSLANAVPTRPVIAVYHHVRRKFHPMKCQGPWRGDEDQRLEESVKALGPKWEKVSICVGRAPSDCRDRYRNHIVGQDTRVMGTWSKEEEEELTRIVAHMTTDKGLDIDNDIFWTKVGELMGGTRGRQQCKTKWADSLSRIVKGGGVQSKWGPHDATTLIRKIEALNVVDDTEIDWKLLPDSNWNLWSAHTLQRRWLTMKRSVKGYEGMTHQEIVNSLSSRQQGQAAPSGSSKRKKRKKQKPARTDQPPPLATLSSTVDD